MSLNYSHVSELQYTAVTSCMPDSCPFLRNEVILITESPSFPFMEDPLITPPSRSHPLRHISWDFMIRNDVTPSLWSKCIQRSPGVFAKCHPLQSPQNQVRVNTTVPYLHYYPYYWSIFLPMPESFLVPSEMISTWSASTS